MENSSSVSNKTTLTGLPEDTEAALTYILGWVSGLFFFLAEKKNPKIRFHALQSICAFGAIHIVMIILGGGYMILPFAQMLRQLVSIGTFVLWLVLIVKTYQGDKVELPIISNFVKKQLK